MKSSREPTSQIVNPIAPMNSHAQLPRGYRILILSASPPRYSSSSSDENRERHLEDSLQFHPLICEFHIGFERKIPKLPFRIVIP